MVPNKSIYLIPGLGADASLFDQYEFPGYRLQVVDWIAPQQQESLVSYAQRLALTIPETEPMLLGVSFGGMIATEISRQKSGASVILLSSVSCYDNIPRLVQWAAASGLIKWLPNRLLQRPGWIAGKFFGITSPEGKQQLTQILRNTPPGFTRWAVQAIGRWRGKKADAVKLHIHGSSDLVLPPRGKVDHLLSGGHFIVFENARKINELVLEWLLENNP